ncbi:hypothetical protein [Archaeoglobus neptunius]|uniref:hypothetical protein n=1 Tax=Archaeoglobus neptunius TaxID=2798580 RepID=UPI001928D722|nr:hypothetical protein [Archaeoglobus neptunius]
MIELVIGIVFAAIVLALPYLNDRVGGDMLKRLKVPKIARKKEIEEKIKEVDRELEEVVGAGVSKREGQAEEKVVPLDDAVKTVQIDDNLLEEMETASTIKPVENSEEKLPDVPDLPDLNSDLDMDFEDIGEEVKLEDTDEDDDFEQEEVDEVEFDEEDDLISSIAKEVEVKEEEEIDLLRDLKGQKFSAEELERELQETIQRFKALAGGRG